ncbi:hypothetical protein MXD81_34525 [Microbacteriaceae bacterium K1510]|nr:hypothetical protein [Microbacteriaceae bacterium K1510]
MIDGVGDAEHLAQHVVGDGLTGEAVAGDRALSKRDHARSKQYGEIEVVHDRCDRRALRAVTA